MSSTGRWVTWVLCVSVVAAGAVAMGSSAGATPADAFSLRNSSLDKVRITLVSHPSKTVWTSTSRTVSVPMVFSIKDPRHVVKRIRVCPDLITEDEYWCKVQELKNYEKPGDDFRMVKTAAGWDIYTAPYYKPRSPFQCSGHEYYRPKVRWWVRVVDPRDGYENLASASFGWTVRCAG